MKRISDLGLPNKFVNELIRLAKADRNWMRIEELGDCKFQVNSDEDSWLKPLVSNAQGALSLYSLSLFFVDGPKVFRPTMNQCSALENVEVRLLLEEYSQPFPVILIALPDEYKPFASALCYHSPTLLVTTLSSPNHTTDLVSIVMRTNNFIESSITKFSKEYADISHTASKALRVALNSCLALANYDHYVNYILPKEVERDRSLAKENSDRGSRARARLSLAVKEIKLDRTVKLHRTIDSKGKEANEPTGREMPFHWRKGHWHTVLHGKGKTERKRVLFPPVMVRADLLSADPSEVVTTYQP